MSQLENALTEAYASAPQELVVLDALEINHPAFDMPIRVIRWPVTSSEPHIFEVRHEQNAQFNPGQIVQYIGCPFDLTPPSQSTEEIVGTFTIKVDGINDIITEYMERAAIDGGVIYGIYRTFIKGMELQGPSSRWTGLEFENPRVEGLSFVIEGAVLRWAVRPYGRLYTATEYPGLVVGR